YGSSPVEPDLLRLARAELDADGVPDGPLAVTSGALDAMERVLPPPSNRPRHVHQYPASIHHNPPHRGEIQPCITLGREHGA
uniref:hypothetical protein n=1 Tax=Streptomyces sp. WAC05458 TaxID=2487412 RepID=UPI001C8D6977